MSGCLCVLCSLSLYYLLTCSGDNSSSSSSSKRSSSSLTPIIYLELFFTLLRSFFFVCFLRHFLSLALARSPVPFRSLSVRPRAATFAGQLKTKFEVATRNGHTALRSPETPALSLSLFLFHKTLSRWLRACLAAAAQLW